MLPASDRCEELVPVVNDVLPTLTTALSTTPTSAPSFNRYTLFDVWSQSLKL
eukprot:m.5558 g.5558  ORF g.5558 m.5558 type:complete len:52 (+) comp6704_c0_seq1:567-722(+)